MGRNSAVAKSVKSDDEYQYQRTYPAPFQFAPITGWFSYYSSTGIERTQNDVLSGRTRGCSSPSLVDLISNDRPRAATCC